MDADYVVKRTFTEALEDPKLRDGIRGALAEQNTCALPNRAMLRYEPIDEGNARLRGLFREVVTPQAWKLLWIPPSLSYYALGGAFASPELQRFTKRLVFSAWRVVPRAIAAMVSYEVERQMFSGEPNAENTPDGRKRFGQLLRFSKTEGRLTGMPVLALLYPSLILARHGDPVRLSARLHADTGRKASIEEMLSEVRDALDVGLERLGITPQPGPVDERWYWAAPLLLDAKLEHAATSDWVEQDDLAARWIGEVEEDGEPDLWAEHVAEARRMLSTRGADLRTPPDDLVDVLAMLALAGPAVSMFRALERVVGGERGLQPRERVTLRNAAGETAWAFRALFNQPEVTAMLRAGTTDDGYWRIALRYCVDGCLQAVLDEYVHVLREHLGLLVGSPETQAGKIATYICEALALRTTNIVADELATDKKGAPTRTEQRKLRTHFALRFGDAQSEDEKDVARADQVRKAFNSPFWPFVLATTSVGQEGLDFHTYCHAVVHWNLPTNPVDLEQREGRVHRYKGLAVRRNVAHDFGMLAIDEEAHDPWEWMFDQAHASRRESDTDIVPYWVYTGGGPARIERHVSALPLSRDMERAQQLSRSLALYRMVFGQPRQEDLVGYLTRRASAERVTELIAASGLDLSPHGSAL